MRANHKNTCDDGPYRAAWMALLLVGVTLAIYGQTVRFDFVGYDDKGYVTQNQRFLDGVTVEDVRWAFTSTYMTNWHPLTWLSHMLDVKLFGLHPGGHHLTSVLFHALNALLLFGVLRALTRAFGPSLFVAVMFAVHPLHVETVAWVSERKDVLSTFFALASISTYVAYARRPGPGRYIALALLLALGLMAKPMMVTLPCLFLLLDFWPLDRSKFGVARPDRSNPREPARCSIVMLLIEKVPLLILSALSSVVTFYAQHESRFPGLNIAFMNRVANAVVSYVRYIGKTIWPDDLIFLYPHPNFSGGQPWATWQITAAAAVLVAITATAIWLGRRRRYLITGWFWFVGVLVPAIGLVQVGLLAMADRYTYVPMIGLSIMLAWGAADLIGSGSRKRVARARAVWTACVLLVSAWSVCAWFQARTWRNSLTLYEHALKRTPNSPLTLNNLGSALTESDRDEEAIAYLRRALEIKPDLFAAWMTLGDALRRQKESGQALDCYREAVRLRGDSPRARNVLAEALAERKELEEAIHHYRASLDRKHDQASVHFQISKPLFDSGQPTAALNHLRHAARIRDRWPDPVIRMAWLLAHHPDPEVRDVQEATELARRAVKMTGETDITALDVLAKVHAAAGRYDLAASVIRKALEVAKPSGELSRIEALEGRLARFERRGSGNGVVK